jgi:uncharacterized glyoxalase superfamily protein PhnB
MCAVRYGITDPLEEFGMNDGYKPEGYNSVSPYIVADEADRLIGALESVFNAVVTRRFTNSDGTVMHAELRIDDSIVMMSDSTASYPANHLMLHVYVPDVDAVFQRAIEAGFSALEKPHRRSNDPDRRGMVGDHSGNVWAIATQAPSDDQTESDRTVT